ncbi:MAG: polysaccharide biosynthesis protein, partial [Thermodesulfovibrionales bacterium]
MNTRATKIYQAIKNLLFKYRRIIITLIFLIQASASNYLAFIIRFESILSSFYLNIFLKYLPLLLGIRLFFFISFGLYKGLWRYASISDLVKIMNSATFGSLFFLVTIQYIIGDLNYPRSIYILDWLLFILISGGSRFFIRVFREYMFSEQFLRRILIVGAGDTGEMIVREMKNNSFPYEPIGFIDDDKYKKGLTIHGIPILGTIDKLPSIITKHQPDEILITESGESQELIKMVYELSKPYNIPIKKVPRIDDILNGNISVGKKLGQALIVARLLTEQQIDRALELQRIEGGKIGENLIKLGYITEEKLVSFLSSRFVLSQIKPVSLVDLLQREPVKTDIESVKSFIKGKAVMVTGAGGSIGSELCRQIINYDPSNLILIDRYENSLFEIDLELKNEGYDSKITTHIGDIQDKRFIDNIFSRYRPEIIFHAAAYKHVPLMENNPVEAVKNNILGTRNVIEASRRYCADHFVLISTDKAVNPTSIMGATKRIAEYLTISTNSLCQTKFSVVRFGNVLGTNGSVLPIFQEQLKKGGPLTVTHPEIKRFFMLIPEAVQLVLIAAAIGNGGELFVLDMGEPLKIVDLAENFIRLSGFIPHKEIKIKFTGLRPGEKLYEELFDNSERIIPTAHKKLFIAIPEIPEKIVLDEYIKVFEDLAIRYSPEGMLSLLKDIVPNFKKAETSITETVF